jgi:hypothetical protein
VTSAGAVRLSRQYFRCPACGDPAYPLDSRLGLEGFLSIQATRLACLAAASWSFDVATDRLAELAGVVVDGDTLRRHVQEAAQRLQRHRLDAEPAAPRFAAASGDVEFLSDGVFVPTRTGWRDLKLALFQKRPRGQPAGPEEWATRPLPAPTATVAYATLADSEVFTACWRPWAERLGVVDFSALTVLADGAEWIWRGTARQFPGAREVLDPFHALQHVAAAAQVLYGDGAEAADWTTRVRRSLLGDGWPGLCDQVGVTLAAGVRVAGQAAIDDLVGYFAKHTGRLGYYGRLQAGRSIGSGAVEGLARRMGDRLKTPGRGCREDHLEPMATLVNLVQRPNGPISGNHPRTNCRNRKLHPVGGEALAGRVARRSVGGFEPFS